jgi:hypothetical protein
MATTECGSCHQEVYWCLKDPPEVNDKGKPKTNPVNPESVGQPGGNLEVWSEPVIPTRSGEPAYVLKFRYRRKTDGPLAEGHKLAVSHFATCPDADKWRRR